VIASTPEEISRIKNILMQLDTHLQKSGAENQRRLKRVPLRMAMTVMVITERDKPVPVQIFSRNISLSGMGFVSRRPFQPDERVALTLEIPEVPPKMILGRIVFGRYLRNNLHEMGLEFLESTTVQKWHSKVPAEWLARRRQGGGEDKQLARQR
jgi:hypothetical protein